MLESQNPHYAIKTNLEHNENVGFDWSVCVVKKLDRPVLAVWFDSNAVEMTTAEHDLTKVF